MVTYAYDGTNSPPKLLLVLDTGEQPGHSQLYGNRADELARDFSGYASGRDAGVRSGAERNTLTKPNCNLYTGLLWHGIDGSSPNANAGRSSPHANAADGSSPHANAADRCSPHANAADRCSPHANAADGCSCVADVTCVGTAVPGGRTLHFVLLLRFVTHPLCAAWLAPVQLN